ncbi:MAG TPA: AAA family ATPase, partial [Myxococcota bacterium]|nr:AAA family ATPase [Myxococcota bacterium]
MRVKKLEIFGFKSFANRQTIAFGEGITGIVGPNGCGKSNVVDAMRWVMGEQNPRQLRGGNMQDIIFCGSEKKAPLGFAEVILTIDNGDQDAPLEYNHFGEIEIARRLYKTGESEYEINRQKARLKDISDFFLGTGVGTRAYSIIEQGRINDIVSAKPLDRRSIVEEAAGITKYKARKAAAERRMESTRINLNRIVDIKNEVDKRVLVSQKEKDKLLKVQAYKQEIQRIDLHLASHGYLSISAQSNFLNRSREFFQRELQENERTLAMAEQVFSRILSEYSTKQDRKRWLEEIELQHHSTHELLKKDLEYKNATQSDNLQLVTRINAQLDEIEARKLELCRDIDKFQVEHAATIDQFTGLNVLLTTKKEAGISVVEARQKNMLDERETQRNIVNSASLAARLQAEINGIRELDAQRVKDIKNLELELSLRNDEFSEVTKRIDVISKELQSAHQRKTALETSRNDVDSNLIRLRKKDAELAQELRHLEEERMAATSRLTSLGEIDARLEWSESGISDLLQSAHKEMVKSVIADIIKVKPGAEDTVEQCLNHLLDAAVLSDRRDLCAVAEFLKKQKSQQTAFFLLSESDLLPHYARPIGLRNLSDFLEIADPSYAQLMAQFSRLFLAENLHIALEHWPAARMAQGTIVSLDGEMLYPDGRAVVLGKNS